MDAERRLPTYNEAIREFWRDYLTGLLRDTGGDVVEAARVAGLSRTHFFRKLRKFQISSKLYRVHRPPGAREQLTAFRRRYLHDLMKETAGNVSEASRISGLWRQAFYRLLTQAGVTPNEFRAADSINARRGHRGNWGD